MKRKGPASSAKAGRVLNAAVHAASAAELFSAFDSGATGAPTPFAGQASSLNDEVDLDFAACFKLLSKKDHTTKYKALRQLQEQLKANKPEEALKTAYGTFASLLAGFVLEGSDPRVREALAQVITDFVIKLQKQATPVLPQIMPSWMLLMFDSSKSVMVAAQQGFAKAFREDKRRLVLQMCQSALIRFFDDALNMTPATLAAHLHVTNDDVNADRYERLLCTALAAKAEIIVALDLDDSIHHKFLQSSYGFSVQSACAGAIMKVQPAKKTPLSAELAKAALVFDAPKLRLRLVSSLVLLPLSQALLAPELENLRRKFFPFLAKERNWSTEDIELMALVPWNNDALDVMLPAMFHAPERYYALLCRLESPVDPVKALLPVRKFLDGECPGLPRVLNKFRSQLQSSEWPQSAWELVDAYLLEAPITARWIEVVAALRRDLWQQRLDDVEYHLVPLFLANGKASLSTCTAKDLFTKWKWQGDVDFLRSCALYGDAPEEAMIAYPRGFSAIAKETCWNLSCFDDIILETAEMCDETEDAALLSVLQAGSARVPFLDVLMEVLMETERWSVLCDYEGLSSTQAVTLVSRMDDAPPHVLRQIEPLSQVFPAARASATILSQLAAFDPGFCCSQIPDVDLDAVTQSTAPWFGGDNDFILASRLVKAGIALPATFPRHAFCDYAWKNQEWDSVARLSGVKNLGRRFVSQLELLANPEDAYRFLSRVHLDARTRRFLKRLLRTQFKPIPAYLYASAAIECSPTSSSTSSAAPMASSCPPAKRKANKKPSPLGTALLIEHAAAPTDEAKRHREEGGVITPEKTREESTMPLFNDDRNCPRMAGDEDDGVAVTSGCVLPRTADAARADTAYDDSDDSCPEITDDEGMDNSVDESDDDEDALDTWLIDVADRAMFWRPTCDRDLQLAHTCFCATACARGVLSADSKTRLWSQVTKHLPAWQARRVLQVCPESPAWATVGSCDDIRDPAIVEDLVDAAQAQGEGRQFLERVAVWNLLEGPYEAASAKAYQKIGDKEMLTDACTKALHPVIWTLFCDSELSHVGHGALLSKIDKDGEKDALSAESREKDENGRRASDLAAYRMDLLKERAREIIVKCMNHAPFKVPKNVADATKVLRGREDADAAQWSVRCLCALWLLWPQVVRLTFEEQLVERKLTLGLCKSLAPTLISCAVQNAQKVLSAGKPAGVVVNLRYVASARQATLTFKRDEMMVDLLITFGDSFPLAPPKMTPPECGSGIPKGRFRNWMLVCQNGIVEGAMGSALLVWVQNFALFFDGLEDCPICYSVVHAQTGAAPRKPCPTCKYKFHSECLFKWFRTSSKTTCPLCNQPF